MKLTLKIWRQKNRHTAGKFETYQLNDVGEDMSFLEMMDVLNQKLLHDKQDAVAFDHAPAERRDNRASSPAVARDDLVHGIELLAFVLPVVARIQLQLTGWHQLVEVTMHRDPVGGQDVRLGRLARNFMGT